MCPDLKKRIEALVYKLVNERYGLKRKRETVDDVLAFLKCLAADPFDQMWEAPEGWVDEILRARKALFQKDAEINNADDFPSRVTLAEHSYFVLMLYFNLLRQF